jgi:transcriptional regulator with XRE-family HTH domain
MELLPKRILQLRENAMLSQARLARELEISQTAINRYEHGDAAISAKALCAYADFFDISVDYLLGRCADPQEKLYNYQPEFIKSQLKNSDEWHDFIEMCFDPASPMSSRFKETLFKLAGADEK